MKPLSLSISLIVSLLSAVLLSFSAKAETTAIASYDAAVEYCDTHSIDNVEGIWQLTDDNVTIFICKDEQKPLSGYSISVIDNCEAFISCGEVIGSMQPTADTSEFKLTLFTQRNAKTYSVGTPEDCLAKLTDQGYAMVFSSKNKRKYKLTFNPLALLPRLWRVIRITPETQTDQYKRGMVKLYPTYDHNGSYKHIPRYL